MTERPIVEFCRLIPNVTPPKRADRSAAGHLPGRAMRYCEALTTATGHGYWLFPPIELRLIFDGEQVAWSFGDHEEWFALSATMSRAVQFPDFADQFDQFAPEGLAGYSPPFVSALPELGSVQIWTGLLARTRPGWSLSVRPPVNLPVIPGLATWEGVIETDIWFGPLFSNFRITKTDTPIHIRADTPFLQVQPVPQIAYAESTQASFAVKGPDSLSEADWQQLGEVLLPHPDRDERQGHYAVKVRKRRTCPVDHRSLIDSPAKE